MTDLAAPNATQTERALIEVTRRIEDVPVPIAHLWDVARCPESHLAWLAWTVSVDVWDDAWSVEEKRAVIRQSIQVHRLKGTRASVETALGALGFNVDISEWFDYGGPVHTFRIDALADDVFEAGLSVDGALLDQITRLIETTKPVRSHFTLRIGESYRVLGHTRATTFARAVNTHEMQPGRAVDAGGPPLALRIGMRARRVSRATHIIPVPGGAAYAA